MFYFSCLRERNDEVVIFIGDGFCWQLFVFRVFGGGMLYYSCILDKICRNFCIKIMKNVVVKK